MLLPKRAVVFSDSRAVVTRMLLCVLLLLLLAVHGCLLLLAVHGCLLCMVACCAWFLVCM